MKQFKDILSEVGQPKAPEEKRFKGQHEIEKIDHPVALDTQFSGDIEGLTPKKRPADNAKGDDSKAYDKAYKKKVAQTLPKRGVTITADDTDLSDDYDWSEEQLNALAEALDNYDLEDLTEEEIDEVIGRAAKAIGRGIKRQTIDRFTTSGQAGRAERQADKLEKKMKAKERLKKAQERLQKAKDAIQKAKEAERNAARSESVDIDQMSITEILGFKNKKPGEEEPKDDMEEDVCSDCNCKMEDCECKVEDADETESGDTLDKQPKKAPKVKEEDVDTPSADTLDDQPEKASKTYPEKKSPSAVEIGIGGSRKIKVTFKEMLEKISTEEELLESPQEEIPMMLKQLHFICYASEEIGEYLRSGVDPEEWWQNKLADVFSNVKSLYAYSKGDQLVSGPKAKISAAAMFDKSGMIGFAEATNKELEESEYELEESSVKVSGNGTVKARPGQAKLDNGKRVKVDKDKAQLLTDFFKQLKPRDRKEMASKLMQDEDQFNEVIQFAEITVGG